MNIAFVVERPTQFDAPFFRFAFEDSQNQLTVYFPKPPRSSVFDPELEQEISWGFDLVEGYSSEVIPKKKGSLWLRRALATTHCGLIIINGYTQWDYLRAAIAARRCGVPTALRIDSVTFPHAPPPSLARRLVFRTLLTPLFDVFFGVGSLTLAYLRQLGVPDPQLGLFPYAVDHAAFHAASVLTTPERDRLRKELGVPDGSKAVLAVSKLNEREAPRDLLEAIALHRDRPWFLLIAGDGPARLELERFAQSQLPDRHRFLGYVPYPDLPRLYGAADLFVHAPQQERWGVSVAEALATGLPAVTSNRVGAAHDLIESGRNGYLYEAGDPRALASRLQDALVLQPAIVESTNRKILPRWGYQATWESILRVASELEHRSHPRTT